MERTILDLNSKWWYRLIKAVYLMLLFLSIAGSSVVIFFLNAPEYDNKPYIKCANGKEFVLSEDGTTPYSDFIWTTATEQAEYLCSGLSSGDKIWPVPQFEHISKYKNRDWFATIGFSLLSALGVLFVFELARRIFYYVVLGKLLPRK